MFHNFFHSWKSLTLQFSFLDKVKEIEYSVLFGFYHIIVPLICFPHWVIFVNN